MRTVKDWRSPKTENHFVGLDYADFAQEFLRRSPDYSREYYELERRVAAGLVNGAVEREVLAQRWGLSFPVRPRSCPRRRACVLGAGGCDHHRCSRCRAR